MKTYDIVIPLGKGGHKFGDIELKYALRSIEKYLTGYRDIYLITWDWPAGFKLRNDIIETKNGEKIRHPGLNPMGLRWVLGKDVPLRKQFSLMNKLLSASGEVMVSQDFIYFHDDHYLLKPLDVSEIKNWYEGNIKDHIGKAVGKYKTACENTMNAIDGGKYFDIHTPCIFNKAGIRDLSHLNWKENEYIIKSLYLNTNKGEEEEMSDCKINQPKSKKEIEERIKDRLFFSTGHNSIKPPMIKLLEELYPEKSRYESN